MKLKIKGALFRCGRCRKSYSNPFGHTCVAPIGRAPGKTRFMPSASATCPGCHKPYGNPLTHNCTVRTDFKRRTAKARKDAAAAKRKARPEHPRFSACQDGDCKRTGCVAYKEGCEHGFEDGYQDGYDKGFPDGIAACPRTHK